MLVDEPQPIDLDRDSPRRRYAQDDTVVELRAGRLTISQSGKRVVDRRIPAAWRGRSYDSRSADLTCHNDEFLASAFVVPHARMVVLDIAYHGTDTCWEPTDELHVVSW
ncbi:MAG TPA: hypothetical protein VLX92_34030 [Kofleriaceae bacterium]|nr:hypothetical protein [Kofleriaceae bacterium]